MRSVKQINIVNQTYSFFNDMIKINNFDSNLRKIDKKLYQNIDVCFFGHITIKNIGDYDSIHSVNPFVFYYWWSRWILWRKKWKEVLAKHTEKYWKINRTLK